MLAQDKPKTLKPQSAQVEPIEGSSLAQVPSPASCLVPPLSVITWEKLPDDFILPDDPVDNIHQPGATPI
jgi:hypothetical protein